MNFKFRYIIIILIFSISIFGCDKISKTLEDKVNEKIDKSIDESMNKIDSIIRNGKIDSLKTKLDTSIRKLKEKINK